MNNYFCGWYLKCQSQEETIALIPAFHRTAGETTCSLQVITNHGAWNLPIPVSKVQKEKGRFSLHMERNYFSEQGLDLHIHTPDLSVYGLLHFGPFTPLRYDIMGPFRLIPFLECRHSVFSMAHSVNGALTINGTRHLFINALGYMEGDRGCSFPREYLWTQCLFPEGSLMLSAADIPLGSFHFTGIIGIILWKGKEFRFATYLGAKIKALGNGKITVAQGPYCFSAQLLKKNAHNLQAPNCGSMSRTIRESPACTAAYRFKKKGDILFSFTSQSASFEYEYPY